MFSKAAGGRLEDRGLLRECWEPRFIVEMDSSCLFICPLCYLCLYDDRGLES